MNKSLERTKDKNADALWAKICILRSPKITAHERWTRRHTENEIAFYDDKMH